MNIARVGRAKTKKEEVKEMRIESTGASGNIQQLASAAISSAAPLSNTATASTPEFVPVQSVVGSGLRSDIPGISDFLSDKFDTTNLGEKLKDPAMKKEFDKALDFASKVMFKENSSLKFSRHEATGTTLVKLVNTDTNETIKEFPSERLLNIIAGIWEVAGILVDKKA